jgi:hypothetical protein
MAAFTRSTTSSSIASDRMAARQPRHALALSPRVAAVLAGGVIFSFIHLDDEGAGSDVTRFCGRR